MIIENFRNKFRKTINPESYIEEVIGMLRLREQFNNYGHNTSDSTNE